MGKHIPVVTNRGEEVQLNSYLVKTDVNLLSRLLSVCRERDVDLENVMKS